jgi:hypothetical protein
MRDQVISLSRDRIDPNCQAVFTPRLSGQLQVPELFPLAGIIETLRSWIMLIRIRMIITPTMIDQCAAARIRAGTSHGSRHKITQDPVLYSPMVEPRQ